MVKAERVGEWAFLACVVIAILAGIAVGAAGVSSAWVALLLVVLGVIVGLTTVTEKEVTPFLVAAVALVVVSARPIFTVIDNAIPLLGSIIDGIVVNITIFVAPAAIIIAVKAVYALASKK